MIREIVKYPDAGLRKACEPVVSFDDELRQLAKDMMETLYAAPGIGLAAPQIGVNKRLILVDLTVGSEEGHLFIAVNPLILEACGSQYGEEGCLSVPDIAESVTRPSRVVIRAQDLNGKPWELVAEELLARCFCHEIDHLDGVLFIDRLSPLKRNLAKRKLRKAARIPA
jgi:peptide deformylase